jgi:hypothetical protein
MDDLLKKKIRKEVYILGYEVGYFNHVEWFGWVFKKKEALLRKAKQIHIRDIVMREYEKGMSDGTKMRMNEVHKGMGGKTPYVQKEPEILPPETAPISTPQNYLQAHLKQENIQFIKEAIPVIHDVILTSIHKMEDEVKIGSKFIDAQQKNIHVMDEGIGICNKLMQDKKDEIKMLQRKVKDTKNALRMIQELKGKIEHIWEHFQAEEKKPKLSREEKEKLSYIQ